MISNVVNYAVKKGGALLLGAPNSVPRMNSRAVFALLLVGLLVFLVKAWLIKISYNAVVPHIMVSLDRSYNPYASFMPISYAVALILSILIYLLF